MKSMPSWFKEWEGNHFRTVTRQVKFNTRLLWILLGSLIAASLIERLC